MLDGEQLLCVKPRDAQIRCHVAAAKALINDRCETIVLPALKDELLAQCVVRGRRIQGHQGVTPERRQNKGLSGHA